MRNIVEEIKKKDDFHSLTGASSERIEQAEKELGIKFSSEYKSYLQTFGCATFEGHDLTGFSPNKYFDVVYVTKIHREDNPNADKSLYVIEEAHIDGIVIWQSPTGEVYLSEDRATPQKIHNSLLEYVDSF